MLRHVLPSRRLAYAGRVGSLARLRVAPPTRRDRVRLAAQLPWFARNLLVKVGLRLLRPTARLTGRPVPPDPY